MGPDLEQVLRDLGRGMVGALLFGTPFLFTMETWWLGWRLPGEYLLAYTVVGLVLILLVVNNVGFREERENRYVNDPWRIGTDFAEVVLESFAAAYVFLLMFGIIKLGDPASVIARLGLMTLVPLALGAALADEVLRAREGGTGLEAPFPRDLAIFALGALFFTFPIAPTEEMELMASHAGWDRLLVVMVASLLITHLALYELEFRGHHGRLAGLTLRMRWGETFLLYAIALLVSFTILGAFGHFKGAPVSTWIQQSIVLAFPAALGGSAARVVL